MSWLAYDTCALASRPRGPPPLSPRSWLVLSGVGGVVCGSRPRNIRRFDAYSNAATPKLMTNVIDVICASIVAGVYWDLAANTSHAT